MKKTKIILLTITMILGVSVLTGCTVVDQNQIEEQKRIQEEKVKKQEECEHDWVITSEFDWIWETYKTISKCSKCGKEV